MTMIIAGGLFPLGQIVRTPGVIEKVPEREVAMGLIRHISGDWGELDEHDRRENETSLLLGFRLLSRYVTSTGTEFWIITELDRSVTTVLLPAITDR